MSGTTERGIPFIQDSDPMSSYPATSETLANELEAELDALDTRVTNLPDFKFGLGGFSTNASGQITITHGLGKTPQGVSITPYNLGSLRAFTIESVSSTTVVCSVRNADGTLLGNGMAANCSWIVVAA